MRKKVLILTDKEGWHFTQLKSSLSNLNYQSMSCNLNELSLIINNNKSIIVDSKFEEINVDYVVVRYIPGGTLEEIISYLNILKTFELNNTKVINTAENIEKTVDKSLTWHIRHIAPEFTIYSVSVCLLATSVDNTC